jgi:heme exporter protein D
MSAGFDFGRWAAMGGYAGFVWPAYAVALLVLSGLALQSILLYRSRQRELAKLQAETRA